MKNETALKQFKTLQVSLEKDKDPYLFVHFSQEDDHYKGVTSKDMDIGDALIVIEHLMEQFGINGEAVAAMERNNSDVK